MAHLVSTIRNDAGSIVPGATVTIYDAGTTNPVELFSDSGLVTEISNPTTVGNQGILDVYLASGSVDILIQRSDIEDRTIENVDIIGAREPGNSVYVMSGQTTDATPTELLTSSGGRIPVPLGKTISVEATVVGQVDGGGNAAFYTFDAAFQNAAGTTTRKVHGASTEFEDDATWNASINADDTNDSAQVLVQGVAATTINWTARAVVVEA